MEHNVQIACEYLATGPRLAHRLRIIGGVAESGDLPLCGGRILNEALDRVEVKLRRLDALRALTEAFNPDGELSSWKVCGMIADALERFEVVGYRRVSSGHRQPSATEKHLSTLIECDGPKTQRKLFAELTQHGQ
jgi:hypothetical protein